ncbi:hypothetical protein BGX27_006844 [Mortierella sp. AM989]|nr:hypothetical protein BGX27_006844 [Mortierella sp. AM989]
MSSRKTTYRSANVNPRNTSPIPPKGTGNIDIEVNCVSSKPPHRLRTRFSYDEKSKLLAEWDKCSEGESIKDFCDRMGVKRITFYGFLKCRKTVAKAMLKNPSRASEMSRDTGARAPEVEERVAGRIKELKTQGILCSDSTICTMAIEFERMLYICSEGTIKSPCLFTSGWLEGFMVRKEKDCQTKSDYPTLWGMNKWKSKIDEWELHKVKQEDMYTCGITGMFLDMAPPTPSKEWAKIKMNGDWVSILLCCDGSVNGASAAEGQEPRDMEPYTTSGSLTSATFEKYLQELDSSVGRVIYLFVNNDIWSYVPKDLWLKNVKIICVPDGFSGHLPMNTRIMKEFKAIYHRLIVENDGTYMPQSQPINVSWSQVQTSTITEGFQLFQGEGIELVREASFKILVAKREGGASAVDRLREAMKDSRFKKEHIRHYTYQDGNTGPSAELWSQLQAKRQEFQDQAQANESKKRKRTSHTVN